ncbi:hypothetical protein ACWCQN_25495 [Streptomyces sp. NPDC001984]
MAGAVVLLPVLTLLLTALRGHLSLSSDLVIYLLVVVVVALAGGLYPDPGSGRDARAVHGIEHAAIPSTGYQDGRKPGSTGFA